MFTYDRQLIISTGASRTAKLWTPQRLSVSELYTRLQVPARGQETLAAHLAMPKAQRDALKDIGGFVGGELVVGRRKAGSVVGRDVITLDFDHIPAGGTTAVLQRVEALGCGYCIYSTRKHSPDAPRLRVLFPTDRTMQPDEFEPCARRMAAYIGVEYADPTTFEVTRLMYWPSCCADSEYIYQTADRPFVSVDGLLATYSDWHNVALWPQVPGAEKEPKRLIAKQGDPTEKNGVVGAFCRCYDVLQAMDAFLPGVYEPVPGFDDRYTFTGGSTTGGAIIYDDRKFLFSHHATDPCSGKLVNAFDLVRLHKFSDLDDTAEPGTPTNRLPSYEAMRELAAADPTVAGLLVDERWAKTQEAFSPVEGEIAEEDDGAWRRPPMMDIDGKGMPERSMKNLRTTLEHDPKLKGRIRMNLFSGKIDVTGALPWDRPGTSAIWSDEDAAQLRIYLEAFFGKVPKNDMLDALSACASDQAYHPVKDYLNSLQWDGAPRLDTLFIDYMGAADTPYTRAVTRKAFTAAVARVMTPGCKYDTMLVLVGAQGRYKSTIFAKMGGEWFSDSLRTFGDKDSMETIQGTWINEVPEMQAMSKTDVNAVKAFLTKTHDYYRAAYGRYTADRARQCVLFGTTNSTECLTDQTGGRRWWPVDIDVLPRKKNVFRDLDAERDQLWAEAVVWWQLGEPLHLPDELEAVAKEQQEAHRETSPREGVIKDFVSRQVPEDWSKWERGRRMLFWSSAIAGEKPALVDRDRICAAEVWCEALGGSLKDMKYTDAREINNVLARMDGWERGKSAMRFGDYGVQKGYFKV